MINQAKISVIVCTYNRADCLEHCLQSLVDQTIDQSLFEVIIVNNNSTDGTIDIAGKYTNDFSNFKLINETKQGLSNARNAGLQASKCEYVAYIDDDAKAHPDWLSYVLSNFTGRIPEPLAVGGIILPFYESDKPDWFKDSYETRSWGIKPRYLKKGEAFSGSNMIFNKQFLLQYGGFSSEYGIVGNQLLLGDESVLFAKIVEKEKREDLFLYDPDIIVYHLVPDYKTQPGYFIKRNFVAGQTNAKMFKNEGLSHFIRIIYFIVLMLIGFILSPLKLLLIWSIDRWKAETISNKFYYIGYILGSFGVHIRLRNK
jgi:glycosyltransferase involved in cell wall biosynthesis